MHTNSTGSLFYPLFSQVLNDKNLSHVEKLTMTLIYGLSDEEGKSYASNEWFCEKLDIKERALQTILQRLENSGYIQRELKCWENNPMKKYRIIYVKVNIKFDTFEGAKFCTFDMQKNAPILDKKDILDKKEIPPTPLRGPVRELFGSQVKLSKEEYEELCKVEGKEVVDGIIVEMNDYLAASGKKPYKDYAAACRQWLRRRKTDQAAKPAKASESNKEWAIKKIDELNKMGAIDTSKVTVEAGLEAVSFHFTNGGRHLSYKENGFKDQLRNYFNKIGITIPNS